MIGNSSHPLLRFLLVSVAVLTITLARAGLSAPASASTEMPALIARAATCESGQSYEPFRRLEELVRQSALLPGLRQELEAGFVKLLAPTSTFEARRFACKQLGIIGTKTALPALAELLKNDETVGIACLALTTYPPGKADDVLRSALGSLHSAVRIQIITTLGDRRDAASVKLLTRLAADTDRSVAEAAIAALGKIGDHAAWKAISALRQGSHPQSEPALIEASCRCAEKFAVSGDKAEARRIYEDLLKVSEPPYIRWSAFKALVQLDEDQGEQRILTVLRGSDAGLKPVAIVAVGSLPSKGASQEFAAELTKLSPEEQAWMIDSLAARGDAPARVAIGNSLASSEPVVRRAAIAALGRIGNAATVAWFVRALAGSKEADERRAIESALVGLAGGVETDQAILAELNKSTALARAHLIAALARRQGSAANAVLLQEAENPDPAAAKAAFRALAKTGQASDAPLVLAKLLQVQDAGVRTEAESAAAQVLARIDAPSRRSVLVRDAPSRAQTVDSRTALLALLPGCGDAEALSTLKTATADPEARVREAAIRALAEWPSPSAWEALMVVCRQPESDSIRGVALRGLVRLAAEQNAHPDSKLADRYMQLLSQARNDADLKLILGALAGAAHPDALQLVVPLLSNPSIRPEAEVAVKKIAEAIKSKYPEAAAEALKKIQAKP